MSIKMPHSQLWFEFIAEASCFTLSHMIKTFSLWFLRGTRRLCWRGGRTRSDDGWSMGNYLRRSCWSCRRIYWRMVSWLSFGRPVEEKIPDKPIQSRLLEKAPRKSNKKFPSRRQEAFKGGIGRRRSEYLKEIGERRTWEVRRDRRAL